MPVSSLVYDWSGMRLELTINAVLFQPFLVSLRAQQIPAFMIPIILEQDPPVFMIDGCLIVEIHDYRPPSQSNPIQSTGSDISDEEKLHLLGSNTFANNPFRGADRIKDGIGLGRSANARYSQMQMETGQGGNPYGDGLNAHASGSGSGIPFQSTLHLGSEHHDSSMVNPCVINRVIMRPDSETLYETILNIHQTHNRNAGAGAGRGKEKETAALDWDDYSVVDLEARVLVRCGPLFTLTAI